MTSLTSSALMLAMVLPWYAPPSTRVISKRAMPQIDAKRVGYWGISQGGWLATFAAIRDRSAAFAVAVSAPLTTPESQMEFADTNHLLALGYSKADVDEMMFARAMWTGYLRSTNSRAQADAAIAKIEKKPWYRYMYMPTVAQIKGPAESTWRTQMGDNPIKADPWIWEAGLRARSAS